MSDNNEEIITNILSMTRDQLSKSMAMSTELEALLLVERKKNFDLENRLAQLENKSKEKDK
jgi:BMFP domain-containing protein YqiC